VNMQLRVCLCLLTVRLLVRHPRPRRGLRPSPTRRSSDLGGKKRRNSGQERVDPPLFDWPENEEERTLLMESLKESILYKRLKSRSEEHTSELQSRENLVCRLLLEKKK